MRYRAVELDRIILQGEPQPQPSEETERGIFNLRGADFALSIELVHTNFVHRFMCYPLRSKPTSMCQNHEDPSIAAEAFCGCAGKGEESTDGALFAFSFTFAHIRNVPRHRGAGALRVWIAISQTPSTSSPYPRRFPSLSGGLPPTTP